MGLTTFAPTDQNLKRFGLAVTLGGGETTLLDLTSAFSIFARGGIKRTYQLSMRLMTIREKLYLNRLKQMNKKFFHLKWLF